MSNLSTNSIITNPISESLNKKSFLIENPLNDDFPSDKSSKMSWMTIILGIIIIGFIVFITYKYYSGGENIYENIYLKIKDLIESIKNWFQSKVASIKSEPSKIEKHMENDHGVEFQETAASEDRNIQPQVQVQAQAQDQPSQNETNKSDLNQALNQATPNYTPHEPGYYADDSYSSIQKSKSSSKSGWCYIGEDRGFRSCISVGDNDTCMSGDIFPTSDICVNPNLRL
jgi:hypothetical protein